MIVKPISHTRTYVHGREKAGAKVIYFFYPTKKILKKLFNHNLFRTFAFELLTLNYIFPHKDNEFKQESMELGTLIIFCGGHTICSSNDHSFSLV